MRPLPLGPHYRCAWLLPGLRELVQSAEPDATWWAQAAIQQIEGSGRRPPGAAAQPSRDDLLARIATGPTGETLAALRDLPPNAAADLVGLHLRLELGMDCIYSMRPRQILPPALALLPVQTEPFHQAVLLRLIRNVLERVLVALPGTPEGEDAQEGIRYLTANPAMVAALRPYLAHPIALTCKEGTAPQACARPERLPDLVEFAPWYEACARTALSTRLGLAAGGVRGLLVSDLGGARALVQQYTALIQAAPDPTTARSFPRDLLLLHPCVGILPPAESSRRCGISGSGAALTRSRTVEVTAMARNWRGCPCTCRWPSGGSSRRTSAAT